MIIGKITFGKTIAMPGYNNDKPEVEATLEDGDTLESVLSALNKRLTDWHITEYPHLYQESKPTHLPGGEAWVTPPLATNSVPIISKDAERLEIAIDNATTLEELATLKESAGKAGLVSAYMAKMNELLTKPREFTDGLS